MNKIRFSELICKIIIKAHLSNTGIKLCAPINHKYSSLTVDEALGILGAKSPRPDGEILRPIHMLTDTPQYDLQIIVPAYNVEKYIIQCIKSICKQTTEYNWQAIIIDDGSKDKTGELIDRYRNNKRIKIIHQKNLGFSGARNTGLSFVNSKYVMFLDSDDFLEKNAIKILLEEAFKYDADVVEGNFYYYKNKKKKPGSFHKLGEVKHPIDTLLGFPWGKIIKSKLLQSYQFPKNYWFEDTIMSFLIYPQCKRARTVPDYVYSYRINNEGITNTLYGKDKCIDTVWVLDKIISTGELDRYDMRLFKDLFSRHTILSCKRCSGLNKAVRESVFVVLRDIYLRFFYDSSDEKVATTDIRHALINNDFGNYELISRLS